MPIHVAITRKVLPGKEDEFKAALRRFLGESFLYGGVQGAAMITSLPGSDSNEIGILRTFANEAERDAFYASKLFKDWEAYASTITEEPVYRQLTGLEAWFRSPKSPPRWKMAFLTFCGVYPTSLVLALSVGPPIKNFPLIVRAFITSLSMVSLLTWVVMPSLLKSARNGSIRLKHSVSAAATNAIVFDFLATVQKLAQQQIVYLLTIYVSSIQL